MESRCILVVEDNELNMEIVVAALEHFQYRVLQAEDAETGLDLARGNLPDLILMDVQLPGMDGYTATRIIKDDPDLKHIPVVMLTAHAMGKDQEQARKCGSSGLISKPFTLKAFREQVKSYLERAVAREVGQPAGGSTE